MTVRANYTAVSKTGRYSVSENSVLMAPRYPVSNKRALIYAHGSNGDATQSLGQNSLPTVAKTIANFAIAQYVVLSGDFGGKQTWGNDTGYAAMLSAISWLLGSGLCASDKVILVGASMGSNTCHRFAKERPDLVAGMLLMMPVLDTEDLRNRNAVGSRDFIDTAWGLATGTTLAGGGSPVPTNGRPMDLVPSIDAIPTRIEYSTADNTCTAAACDTYAAARSSANLTRHISSTTGDHGDGALSGIDIAGCLAFLDAHA